MDHQLLETKPILRKMNAKKGMKSASKLMMKPSSNMTKLMMCSQAQNDIVNDAGSR